MNAKRGEKGVRGGRGGKTKSLLAPKPQFNNLLREVNEMTDDEMGTELLQLPCIPSGGVNNNLPIDTNPSYLSILQDDQLWPVDTILTSASGVHTSTSVAS